MGINFPASPTVGQQYPQPPVSGIPIYTWDGEKWTTVGGSIGAYAPPSTTLPLMDATPAVIGVGTTYARADHIHPTDTTRASDADAVKTVPQTLTSSQIIQARQNVYAAPFDAMNYNGLQVNGSMEVSQENGTAQIAVLSGQVKYIIDNWNVAFTGVPGAVSGFQAVAGTNYPIDANSAGHRRGLCAFATVGAPFANNGDACYLRQNVEAWRTCRLAWGTSAAIPVTYAFKFYSVAGGTIFVRIGSSDSTLFYYHEHTITAASWNFCSATVPGPTTGNWGYGSLNGNGMYFDVCCGGKNTGTIPPLDTWTGTYSNGKTTNSTNLLAATNNYIILTGLIMVPGTEGPVAARLSYLLRPYDQELISAQRYWQSTLVFNRFNASGASQYHDVGGYFPGSFRVAPTLLTVVAGARSNVTGISADSADISGAFRHSMLSVAAGDAYVVGDVVTGDARL